ncbi:MAG: NAD(P)/FAD-dependent oxidoreductase [Myxococcales bacterium]|nr:NAD(P)/FAD-dependent oxidoreductase [Myxococcales bacterium]MCB9750980.1 NAD(P)/FAD-dependent oxidoreductase [Myxococcales bacterium]
MGKEHLDVVIIGAGLSGVGAAVHLQRRCPGKRFALLEGRAAMGGTWDLFRYPGVRSDSDMYTLGYRFKPWTGEKAIADGADIRRYIEEAAAEHGVDARIRYQHKVLGLRWSSEDARWTIDVERVDTGERLAITSQYVMCCAGYYKYERGYTPEFAGRESFAGAIIHPQRWPEELDYAGKRVVVIGSGATAVTLVPALTDKAAHVTMLQRSPGYVISVPSRDALAPRLRRYLPERAVYALTRARKLLVSMGFYHFARAYPARARAFLMKQVARSVRDAVDMRHFTPRYDVWDERLCAVPNGDMFKALRSGRASVVTDHIERFTPRGVLLRSGAELEADIIVTATGLELQVLGGAALTVDGQPVNVAEKLYYKGAMLEDVPNLCTVFGYTNSSWTLKADLIAEFFCRLINDMDQRGAAVCTPRNVDGAADAGPFVQLNSGYIRRAEDKLPRQGGAAPWRVYQNYFRDVLALRLQRPRGGALEFSSPGRARPPASAPRVARWDPKAAAG